MNKRIFDWSRYWYRQDGKEPFIQDGLLIGVNKYGDGFADDRLFELAAILDSPCLILLGEPGMGKSYALESVAKILDQTETEDRFCFIDLADYATASELIQEIFDNNPDFPVWQSADFNLHIFLDGLDEAPFQAKSILNRLQRAINQRVVDPRRFFLRIVCRSSDWKNEFEKQLKDVWGEDSVRAFVLAPLQKSDVLEAAEFCGLNAEGFWHEIARKNAEPFAARPVTLNFLLSEYGTTGQLPRQRSEVYRRGLLSLCRELKIAHEERDQLEPEQRFVISARIAACMIFTGNTTISTGSRLASETVKLTIEDCAGGKEIIGEVEAEAWESSIRETLDTALFQGGELRKWAHHSYAEFLAAYYAINRLSIPQAKALLLHPDGHLVPQLQETAAWIVSLTEDVETILAIDPAVLLRGDVANFDVSLKQDLTMAVLERAKVDTTLDIRLRLLAPLKHPDMAATLKQYIEDKEEVLQARVLAVDMAAECRVDQLQSDILELALDLNEHMNLRVAASRAISIIGDKTTKCLLKPLTLLPVNESSNRLLKLYAIQSTWPDCITAKELFRTLESSEDSLIDSYRSFAWDELIVPKLSSNDLPFALRWVEKQETLHEMPFNFISLLDAILHKCWEYLEEEGVAEAFAAAIVTLWRRHDSVLERQGKRSYISGDSRGLTEENVLGDQVKRKLLFRHLVPAASRFDNIAYQFVFDIPLLHLKDASWLIDEFNNNRSSLEQDYIAALLRRIIRLDDSTHFELIYNSKVQNPRLWKRLNYQLFVELNSEEAKTLKEKHQQMQEWERQRQRLEEEKNPSLLQPPPLERIISYLEAFEEGDLDAWWKMSFWMNVDAKGRSNTYLDATIDFTQLPLWEEIDDKTRSRIIESAPKYMVDYEPDSNPWRDRAPSSTYRPIVAGARAFLILLERQENILHSFQQSVWEKWAPSLIYYAYRSKWFLIDDGDRDQFIKLWQVIYAKVPSVFIESILWIVDIENSSGEIYVGDYLEEFMDDDLAIALLEKTEEKGLRTENAKKVIRLVGSYQYSMVHEILMHWLLHSTGELRDTNERAIAAGQLLLESSPSSAWHLLWPRIQEDIEFGKALIENVAHFNHRKLVFIEHMSELQMADLYIWLCRVYPPENDPKREGVYRVTLEHEIADLRDTLLRQLVIRGTTEAVQQLSRIGETLHTNLEYDIENAKSLLRRNTWTPIEPQQLLELNQDKNARWIQSGKQLLDTITEILQKLEDELQGRSGSTPSAIDLWNEYSIKNEENGRQTRYTPKDENRLSDYVERYLNEQLLERNVFISRETQIRRGSFTDIYVETRSIESSGELGNPISAVIEVKGCWHSALRTAMETQLKERYLAENNISYGIYLVGNFMCDAWSAEDDQSRFDACRRLSNEELPPYLEAQATELSDGYDIRPFILDARI